MGNKFEPAETYKAGKNVGDPAKATITGSAEVGRIVANHIRNRPLFPSGGGKVPRSSSPEKVKPTIRNGAVRQLTTQMHDESERLTTQIMRDESERLRKSRLAGAENAAMKKALAMSPEEREAMFSALS